MQSRALERGPGLERPGLQLRSPVGVDIAAAGDVGFQVANELGAGVGMQAQAAQLADRVPRAAFDARVARSAEQAARGGGEDELHQMALAARRAHLDQIPQVADLEISAGLFAQLARESVREHLTGIDTTARKQIRDVLAAHVFGEQHPTIVHAQRGDADAKHSAGFACAAARRLFHARVSSSEVDL
jgi:hypothetical protein